MLRARRPATGAIGIGAALVMILGGTTACGQGQAAGDPGFEDCATDPVSCNSGERADGGEITWGIDGSWTGWNPNLSAEYTVYTLQVTAPYWPAVGQFDQNADFVVNDAIFAGEPELINQTPMQVEYTLNPDANWGDGNPIGLDDFTYTWYARSGNGDLCKDCTPAAATAADVVSIEEGATADKIVITYNDEYASSEWKYEPVLSNPAHIADEQGLDWKHDPADMAAAETYFSQTVPTWSAGPFKIDDAATGDYAIFTPNEDWAGSTEVTLDKLTLKSFDSLESIITEIRQGTVDGSSPGNISAENVVQLVSEDGINFNVDRGPLWHHIDINVNNEFLSDPVLRTAVFQAIDVEEIIARTYANVQSDAARKLNHLYRNDSANFQDHLTATGQGAGDTEQARDALLDADYSWNSDGKLLDPEGEQVTFNYRYADGSDDRQTMADLVAFNLADIGIDVELKPFPAADLGPTLDQSNFDMVAFGWTSQPVIVNSARQFWASDAPTNYGRLDDPELDALIDALALEPDPAEAAEIGNQIAERVVQDAYQLPLVNTPVAIIATPELVNVRDNWASQQRALYNVAEWGIRAE
ncbi:ABC transporter family substrate-binding protein [Glycomyces artemisiae]|uniref:Peptide/nickel transport system substrate-binding protein n=1 Tax=Glycomyces artemisiae TaxID=1076443 RepID=A0A2T0UTD5_9ACTN|nr:ABC transporter family substrate-binding protein [Glycomyces artemisiae]PRY61191.1 peptide/nickel transport system substrate-binding protein [Glycomyces artemisiae]